jgi:hypothetical protein
MDTSQVTTTQPTSDLSTCGGTDNAVGGLDINTFVTNNPKTVFWVMAVSVAIIVLMLLLMLFGRLHLGECASSKYTSTFTPQSLVGGSPAVSKQNNFGNNPNWYMQDGCAGYNCSVDTASGRSLGFGLSPFDQKKSNFGPLPGVRQHMVASSETQRKAAEELLRRQQNMESLKKDTMNPKREHMTPEEQKAEEERARAYLAARNLDEIKARQARVLSTCENPWDPMATEEAKVLGSVGVYKQVTPGMSSFGKALNDNTPLTDSQLEAIMQGGEPYTIAPAGINDVDELAAQQRQQQVMIPPKKFS